jgi:hypothetical protein
MLDLIDYDTGTTVTPNVAGGNTTLTVSDTGHAALSLTLVGSYSSWTITSDGHGGVDIFDPPAPATIASGGSLDLDTPSDETVTFTGGTGSLVLNDPEDFTGQIIGFTGTVPDAAHSDTIDLVGINYDSPNFTESYNSATGLLTVADGTNTASVTFDDFNATLDFASDGNGGTLITDPPAAESSGTTASASADWVADWAADLGMKIGNGKITLDAGQSQDQTDSAAGADGTTDANGPKDLLVSFHNDNFIFHQNLGTQTGANPAPHGDSHELADHHDAQLTQQLAALVTPDPHHEWLNDLIHSDSHALPSSATPAQWHNHLSNTFHLH